MVIAALILIGLCLGSFVNAFVWRFHEQAGLAEGAAAEQQAPKSGKNAKARSVSSKQLTSDDLSITRGRSMCVHCHHPLAARDLVPVLSYVWLRGKCRYCGKPIQDTPFAELVTPAAFVLSYLLWPVAFTGAGLFTFCLWLVFIVGLAILALYDIKWFELPHKIVLPLIGLAVGQVLVVALCFGGGVETLARAGLGALVGGGLFFLLYIISPKEKLEDGAEISKWIGGGDITLGVLLGTLVGGPGEALLLIFVASLLGTLVAIPLLAAGKAGRGTHLPFGPYLILAALIVMLWGDRIITGYTSLFI